MKKILIILFIFVMSIGYGAYGQTVVISSKGYIQSVDDFVYVYDSANNKVSITGYIGKSGIVSIPTTLANYTVSKIEKYAFDRKGIIKVILNEGLVDIIFNAFSNNSLTELIIPSSVKTIGSLAFDNNNIKIISFKGSTVPTLGQNVFYRNTQLTNVCISDEADLNAWREALTSAGVSTNVNIIQGRNGACAEIGTGEVGDTEKLLCGTNAYQNGSECVCLSEYDGDPYTMCSLTLDLTCYSFSSLDNVSTISSYNCTNTTVIIPDKYNDNIVKKIASKSFEKKGIVALTLGSNIEQIGSEAFSYNSIKTVTMPNKVSLIGEKAFYGNSLKTLVFSSTIPPTISSNAFGENKSLSKICVPKGTTESYKSALASSGLPNVTYYEDASKCVLTNHDFVEGDISYTCNKTIWCQSNNIHNYLFECSVQNMTSYDLENWIIDLEMPTGAALINYWGARTSANNNIVTIKNNTSESLKANQKTSFSVVISSPTDFEFDDTNSSGGTSEEEILIHNAITDGLSATLVRTSNWSDNYIYTLTINNQSGVDLVDWVTEIEVPSGTTMVASWNADYTLSNNIFKLTPKWNNLISNGNSINFSFQMQYAGTEFNPVVKSVKGSKQ